jgi:hypothetical protein
MAAPTSTCLHVQMTWTYLTYLQYFSTPGGMYYSICMYYSIYNLSVISDANFLCRGTFCVGKKSHVDPNLASFQHVTDVLPTCCQHCQLSPELTHSPKKPSNKWSVDSIIVKRVAVQGCPHQVHVSSPQCGDNGYALTWGVKMPHAMVWAKAADQHCAQNRRYRGETSIEKWTAKVS